MSSTSGEVPVTGDDEAPGDREGVVVGGASLWVADRLSEYAASADE